MALTEITDPNELANVRAAFSGKTQGVSAPSSKLQEVTDPNELAQVKQQFGQKTELVPTSEDEEWLPEILKPVSKGLGFVREALGGETVAKLPTAIMGMPQKTGAEVSRELETERRGMIPEYRKVQGDVTGVLQTAANTAADAIAMVGTGVSLPLELGVLAGRHIGQVAGGLATDIPVAAYRAGLEEPAKAMFGEIAAKSLAEQQRRGEYATARAAKETLGENVEFAKGAAFGMSPAAFEAARALAEGGGLSDAVTAGTEALRAYPLASIMPFWHGVKYAGERGGAPLVQKGQAVKTITGKPVVLNEFGKAMYEPVQTAERVAEKALSTKGGKAIVKTLEPIVGDHVKEALEWGKQSVEPGWQRMAYDAVTPKDMSRQQGITAANKILMSGESPAAKNMKIAVDNYSVLRDMQTELSDPKFKAATDLEKFQAIEGTLPGTKQLMEAPVMDESARAVAQELGNIFVQHGMSLDVAQKAVPFTLLEGLRLTKQGQLQNPVSALHTSLANLQNMDAATAQTRVQAFGNFVLAQMKDPNFIAAADQAWSGKGYRWVPGQEIRQRNAYSEAMRQATKDAAAANRPHFELAVPELGELRKDYTYQLFNKMVDDLRSSEQGRAQVAHLLASSPIARMAANPTAPEHIKALAAWHSQPGGARARLSERLNEISVEAVKNHGLAPHVVLKNYDRYVSRAFTDALDAQVKLSGYIKYMGAEGRLVNKIEKQIDSGRFRRRMDKETSNDRLVELISKGDISLHDALASTVVSTMVMANHLHNLSEFHDTWLQQGLLHDTQKPNTMQIPLEKAAPGKQAASPDPYNYAYGKLAGKWVDRQLAEQLNLVPPAMRKAVETMPYVRAISDLAGEVLGFTRFMKTTGNAIVYPIRNALTDPLIPMAASGENPYTGWGRKANLEAKADIDRMVRTRGSVEGLTLSPDLREMIEAGVLDINKLPNDSTVPANMRPQVAAMVKQIETYVEKATDPAERIKALAHAAMYSRMMGSAGFKEMPKAAIQAWQDSLRAGKEAKAQGVPASLRTLRAPSEFMGALNDHLNEIAIAQVISKMEMSRSVWAYKVARHKLNLDPSRAAIFVRDTVYGVDRPSEMMSRVSQNPLSLVILPLFARYGIWQSKRGLQRALSNKNVWTNIMLLKGLDAMNEEDLLHDPFLENNWKGRMNRIHAQHAAAGDIGLGSVGGVQNFLRSAGVPEAVVNSVGKPDDLITQDLTNLIGAQTFLHQYKPERQGLEFATQFGVFGGTLSQMQNDRLQDPDYREQTGLIGPENKNFWTVPREVLKSLVYRAFPGSWVTPVRPEDPHSTPIPIPFIGRAASVAEKAARAKIEGRPAYKNVYGEEINLFDLASREFGSLAPTIVDNASFQARLSRNLAYQLGEMQKKLREELKTNVSPNLPEEERRQRSQEINIGASERMNQLTRAYTWPTQEQNRDEALRKSREAARQYYERLKETKEGK